MTKIRNIVGNVPDPEELYGRAEFIDHLWRQIEGNNLLLLAPRRFGKSGVMRHVLLRPRDQYLPIYLDLEDVDSPAELVWRVSREVLSHDKLRAALRSAKGLPTAVMSWVKDTFDEVEYEGAKVKFKSAIQEDWRSAAKRLLLEMEKVGPIIIFIFDELPAMLDNICAQHGDKAATDFLAWFRSARLQQKDHLRRYRFIAAGSTGIDVTLRRLGDADKLNDFERLYVQPLERDAAVRLIADLGDGMGVSLTEVLTDRVLELIGPPVPYFIHLFFSQLGQLPKRAEQLALETLDEVYQQRVLGPTCKHYFDHYRDRLGRYGRLRERAAMAVLRSIAQASRARVSRSTLFDVYRNARGREASDLEFNELMADLECDWYVSLDVTTNEYFFAVNVMRDWWNRWYAPAPKRRAIERTI